MTIYTISKQDGILYAFQENDGTLLWQKNIGPKLTGALAASTTAVWVGGYDGYVYAMRTQDGFPLWRYLTENDVTYPPMKTDTQSVYFSSPTGIYALKMSSGSPPWRFSTPGCTSTANAVAAISDEILYVFLDGLYALRISDGQVLWYNTQFRLTPAYLVVMNDKVYVPTNKQDQLFVLQAKDGHYLHMLQGGKKARPLYTRAAKDNIASLRVLEKCGFAIFGEGKGFSNTRGKEVEEFLLTCIDTSDQGEACRSAKSPGS